MPLVDNLDGVTEQLPVGQLRTARARDPVQNVDSPSVGAPVTDLHLSKQPLIDQGNWHDLIGADHQTSVEIGKRLGQPLKIAGGEVRADVSVLREARRAVLQGRPPPTTT